MSNADKKLLKQYFNLVFGTARPSKERLKAALNRAHELRQFEIRLYWQRNLMIWGFMFALFTGYIILFSATNDNINAYVGQDNPKMQSMLFAISGLGSLTFIAWLIFESVARSWLKNWEYHIDYLEYSISENLHKTIIGKRATFYSVSNILRTVAISTGIIWILLLVFSTPDYLREFVGFGNRDNYWILLSIYLLIFLALPLYLLARRRTPSSKIRGYWRTSYDILPDNGVDIDLLSIHKRTLPDVKLIMK